MGDFRDPDIEAIVDPIMERMRFLETEASNRGLQSWHDLPPQRRGPINPVPKVERCIHDDGFVYKCGLCRYHYEQAREDDEEYDD